MNRMARLVFAASLLVALATGPARAGLLDTADSSRPWTLDGVECDLLEVPTALPLGVAVSCPGVRPGALVETPVGFCSFNFLFTSGGTRYMGTAGHCILENDGEQSWAFGSGPVARDVDGNRVGEFVYAILQDPKDFALIRLDDSVQASPQMCHFGGPTGLNADQPSGSVVLNHFGQGIGVDLVVPGRSAVALGMPDPDHVFAIGAVVFGDSGSGAISSDGRAVGVVVTTGVHLAGLGTSGIDAGTMGITRLGPQLSRAEQVLGTDLTLATAGLL